MRKNYEMTEAQFAKLLDACKPVAMIALQCGPISSPQENANRAWQALGDELGFDHMTVRPLGNTGRSFTAEAKQSDPLTLRTIGGKP